MVTVYLDSQDFSHFSMEHRDYRKFASLKEELLDLKKNGYAKFFFSDVHIYEVFPKESAATAAGLDRIRVMAEFCGKQSMPSFISLIEHEIYAALSKSTGEAVPTLSHNWFPDLGIANKPLERGEHRPNRKERRILNSQVRKGDSSLTTEIRNKYPFIKNTDLFVKYYAHEAEWADVVKMIESSLQDIERFTSWIATSNESKLKFPDILRGNYTTYVDAVMTIREEVAKRVNILPLKKQKDQLGKEVESALEKSLIQLRSDLPRRLVDDLKNYPHPIIVDESMPSFDVFVRYLAELVRRSSQLANSRKPIGSDFADALHVCYLPRVDIFRTDAAAADALARIHPKRKRDIVGDIFDLPSIIKEKSVF